MLNKIAKDYLVEQDYDLINTTLGFKSILPYLGETKIALEIGSADGVMTKKLVNVTQALDVVEPSSVYAEQIKAIPGLRNVFNCFLEDIPIPLQYDVVLMMGLLHHIENPCEFLCYSKRFVAQAGLIMATVPNVNSIHRQIGVEMGLLNDVKGTSERNLKFKQYGRFTKQSLIELFDEAGYTIVQCYGYMFKPFSSEMMLKLDLSEALVTALYEMGKKYESMCSQVLIVAKSND